MNIEFEGEIIKFPQELVERFQQDINNAVPCPIQLELDFDEERIDAIGRNGGEGLHYPKSIFHDCAEFLRAGDTNYPDLKNADLYETLIGEEYNEWRLELKEVLQ